MKVRIHTWARLIFSGALLLILLSCNLTATKPPPPSCLRTYDLPDDAKSLYAKLAELFKAQGYTLVNQMPSRGYFDTAWQPYEGRKTLCGHYDERRKYEVLLTPELSRPTRVCMHFRLFVEERACRPTSQWRPRSVKALEDEAYLNLLQMMDRSVNDMGGVTH